MLATPRRLRWTALIASMLGLACVAFGHAEPRGRTLRILARYAVPAAPSAPTDVRWASDSSIYLARYSSGVSELRLAEGLPEIRNILRSPDVLGAAPPGHETRSFEMLAVSGGDVMVASFLRHRGWTSIAAKDGSQRTVSRWNGGLTVDLDVRGGRFVLLGESGTFERPWDDGAIAWLGSLGQGPRELKPVLYDATGPGALNLSRCSELELGAVRFLGDGSFLVVPGGQPGAHLYDSRGALRRTWDTARLGLDPVRCSEMSGEEELQLSVDTTKSMAWVNAHRVLDEILPLREGPGLLTRSRVDGIVRWELKVLGTDRVATYANPVTSDRPFDRMRGDVRGERIVLLRSAHIATRAGGGREAGEILIAELPR